MDPSRSQGTSDHLALDHSDRRLLGDHHPPQRSRDQPHADELLAAQQVQTLLDATKASDPALIEEMKLAQLSLLDLHRVLVTLVEERVPIVDFVRIVEAVTVRARQPNKSNEALVEAARNALGARITADHARDGRLSVITIDAAALEQQLVAAVHEQIPEACSPSIPRLLEYASSQKYGHSSMEPASPVVIPFLIVASALRPALARLFAVAIPRVIVMSVNEIGRQVQLDRIGVVSGVHAEARL